MHAADVNNFWLTAQGCRLAGKDLCHLLLLKQSKHKDPTRARKEAPPERGACEVLLSPATDAADLLCTGSSPAAPAAATAAATTSKRSSSCLFQCPGALLCLHCPAFTGGSRSCSKQQTVDSQWWSTRLQVPLL